MRCVGVALLALGCLGIAGCDLSQPVGYETKRVEGGDAAQGLALVAGGTYGCAACHVIPGIRMPRGVAGPALGGMAQRGFIAGQLPNKPGVLVAFLQNPPALVPATGMPNVGLTTDEAKHIAAFLYTLRQPDAR
jgi:cytochrome c2